MRYLLVALALFATPAAAEVRSRSASGFEVVNVAIVAAAPVQVYAMLGTPARWWSRIHTWSQDPANLSLDLKAGGCFCEHLPASQGSVEHGRVIFADPGRLLRLRAALGPLQQEAVIGSLSWALKAVAGGTEVTQSYVVGGYVRGGADRIAPIVDQVLAEQLHGLRQAFAAR